MLFDHRYARTADFRDRKKVRPRVTRSVIALSTATNCRIECEPKRVSANLGHDAIGRGLAITGVEVFDEYRSRPARDDHSSFFLAGTFYALASMVTAVRVLLLSHRGSKRRKRSLRALKTGSFIPTEFSHSIRLRRALHGVAKRVATGFHR